MISCLIHPCLNVNLSTWAYIDPNTVQSVFSGVLPMLLAGLTAFLAVFITPLVFARHHIRRWFHSGSKLRWPIIGAAILALWAGIILVCVLILC